MLLPGCWGLFVGLVCWFGLLFLFLWGFLFVFNNYHVHPVDMLKNSEGRAALNFLCVPELSSHRIYCL